MREDQYVAIYVRTDPRYCHVEEMGDYEEPEDLLEGVPLQGRFPSKLKVDLSDSGGDLVTDFINNDFRVLIASDKARAILEEEGVGSKSAEYLPVAIRDRRGKPLRSPYFVVNTLATVNCFDWKRSTYRTFKSSPREINTLRVLHIDPKPIPDDCRLFRVGEFRRELIIRVDLLERLRRSGCEGLCVVPMGQRRV